MIRELCNSPFDGGAGYTPQQVGDMTLDQIFMRRTDIKYLRSHHTTRTTSEMPIGTMLAGRAADGTPIKAMVRGKSLAREAMERSAARKKIENKVPKETKRDRRRRRAKDGS